VRNHVASIYRKLEVRNKPALIRVLSEQASEYGMLPPVEDGNQTSALLQSLDSVGPSPQAGASIAVMPFVTIGPTALDYIGHGIAADIQHDLTRCHDLVVMGRSSCLVSSKMQDDVGTIARRLEAGFILHGTLRADGARIRLTAELVDGARGAVVWSERYDRVMHDLLDVEAEIARAITASLSLQIEESQYERRRHLEPDALKAYDWRLRGNRLMELGGRKNLSDARDCFNQALALEPASAAVYAGLSMSYGYECDQLLADDYDTSLKCHSSHAERAVEIDEADSRGHYALACALMREGQYQRADDHAPEASSSFPASTTTCATGVTAS
ncbi:MAG: hypothetical protein HOK83_12625, partial [Rhodospirillaceae bacterium]|nr:hypothetical protein [Rhodospirillaceae bacterium]